jgi:hypothetical protein
VAAAKMHYSLPCFVLLVLVVAAAKIHYKEQVLVAGTYKTGWPIRQSGLSALFWAFLLCFVPVTNDFSSKWIFTNKYTLSNLFFLYIYGELYNRILRLM